MKFISAHKSEFTRWNLKGDQVVVQEDRFLVGIKVEFAGGGMLDIAIGRLASITKSSNPISAWRKADLCVKSK